MTTALLHTLMPHARHKDVGAYARHIGRVCLFYHITTPDRLAHFIAQLAHESGSLRYREEIASGAAYENRKDLGNTQPGDGKRFKGRGPIQLTGRANYQAFEKHLRAAWGDPDTDVIGYPQVVAEPWLGAIAAGYFWYREKLNTYADAAARRGDDVVLKLITKRVNGGYNGIQHRAHALKDARAALEGWTAAGLRRTIEVSINPDRITPLADASTLPLA